MCVGIHTSPLPPLLVNPIKLSDLKGQPGLCTERSRKAKRMHTVDSLKRLQVHGSSPDTQSGSRVCEKECDAENEQRLCVCVCEREKERESNRKLGDGLGLRKSSGKH